MIIKTINNKKDEKKLKKYKKRIDKDKKFIYISTYVEQK